MNSDDSQVSLPVNRQAVVFGQAPFDDAPATVYLNVAESGALCYGWLAFCPPPPGTPVNSAVTAFSSPAPDLLDVEATGYWGTQPANIRASFFRDQQGQVWLGWLALDQRTGVVLHSQPPVVLATKYANW